MAAGAAAGGDGAPLNGSPVPPRVAARAGGGGRERWEGRVLAFVRTDAICRPGHGSTRGLGTAYKRRKGKPLRSLVCKPGRVYVAERR